MIANLKRNMAVARRRGQGMTEYIIVVGLVAILLVGVVVRFKEQIRVTIVGTKGKMDSTVTGPMGGGTTPPKPPGPPKPNKKP